MKSWDWTFVLRAAPVAYADTFILAQPNRVGTEILLGISDPWFNSSQAAFQPHMDEPNRENYVWQTLHRTHLAGQPEVKFAQLVQV